jgi:hypothetical protein
MMREARAMKHWIIGGTAAIVGTVLLFRSRTAVDQTIYTPTTGTATTQGIAWPPTSRITRDEPAATTTRAVRGVPVGSVPKLKIAPATEPVEATP